MIKKDKPRFNKKIFSMLLEKGCGERTIKQFASDSGISYLQMRKLLACEQENPPGKKLIGKLASASSHEVSLDEYLFAVGVDLYSDKADTVGELSLREMAFVNKYRSLSSNQKKTIEDFLNFLCSYNP